MPTIDLRTWTSFVLLLTNAISSHADTAKAHPSDQGDNYIITHYGREYYTPATDSSVQPRKSGYFTADVIPVDPNTGEELSPSKNIFVPMHTGYSIAGAGAFAAHQRQPPSNPKKIGAIKPADPGPAEPATEGSSNGKSKIPKKFKNKMATTGAAKKRNPDEFQEPTGGAFEKGVESGHSAKSIPKRQAEVPREFLLQHLLASRQYQEPDRRWSRVNYFY